MTAISTAPSSHPTHRLGRRTLLASVLAGSAFGATALSAAADEWCDTDPVVRLTTPGGRNLVVRVTDSALGVQHLAALSQATFAYTTTPVSNGAATDVTLTVLIPGDLLDPAFRTRSRVSTAANDNSKVYQVYSDQHGTAGTPIVHRFTLPTP